MMNDLISCPLLGKNTDKVLNWMGKNSDIPSLIAKININVEKNFIDLSGKMLESVNYILTGDLKAFGKTIGSSLKIVIN